MGTRTGFSDERWRAEDDLLRRSVLRVYVDATLICLIFFVFIRAFVAQQSEIPTGSMEDTILIGDHVLVNRFVHAPTAFAWERLLLPIREIRRGEIVVLRPPREPETEYIKRVVGLPGENLVVEQGRVFIDGRPIEEPYLNELYGGGAAFGPVSIEDGHYFVLGDNRRSSSDSRSWGAVPRESIRGQANLVLFSGRKTGGVGTAPGRVGLRSAATRLSDLVLRPRWDRCLTPLR